MKNRPYQSGITLIELMIALLIGAFLLTGVIQIFLAGRQTHRMQENLSRMQENGRFALEFLANDIRMAGFKGCNNKLELYNRPVCKSAGDPVGCSTPAKTPNTLNSPTAFLYNFGMALQGFEANSATNWSPTLDAAINTSKDLGGGGSDVITIRRAGDQGFTVTAHASSPPNANDPTGIGDLKLAGTTAELASAGLTVGATALVSDCSAAAVFQVTGITASLDAAGVEQQGASLSHAAAAKSAACDPCNATGVLGKTFVGGQVYPINTISYYVKNVTGQPSLYRRIGANAEQELVEGIESMQILYGEDNDRDGTADYYVSANNLKTSMNLVVSIRISLLVASIDNNLTAAPEKYTFNGASVTPTDRKMRRVFNSTIAIRNRL